MARLPRTVMPGLPVHVTQRGNNRQAVFFCSDDYRQFLDSLRLAAERTASEVHALVLMTNHVHLLVSPSTPLSVSRLMQIVGRRYVRYLNGTHQRAGTLWEGRFKSALIDSERYLLTCMRYVELNSVRANVVEQPDDYPWSSDAHNALGESNGLTTAHPVYMALGDDPEARRAAYRRLCREDEESHPEALAFIRSGTHTGTPIGNDGFRAKIATSLNRRVEKFSYGGDRRGKGFQSLSSTLTP